MGVTNFNNKSGLARSKKLTGVLPCFTGTSSSSSATFKVRRHGLQEYDKPKPSCILGFEQVQRLILQLQHIAQDAGHERPLLIGIDQENGPSTLIMLRSAN